MEHNIRTTWPAQNRPMSKRGVFYGFDSTRSRKWAWNTQKKARTPRKDLAEKGKTQALIVNEQGKLLKAQRQLGALVYSLAKGKEENQPLVDKYIEMIDSIEGEIARLKASLTPAETAEVEFTEAEERLLKKLRCRGSACRRATQDLPAVRCTRLGRCTVLQQVRRTAVTKTAQQNGNGRCPLSRITVLFLRSGKCRRKMREIAHLIPCKTA